ncbi:MAG: class I SAM-dependent methyltransferase [Candidatus Methanodesulfokora washburnensis]|jgi:ubiquinone/menaquinone biosynthesis C-methylase UbiE
MSESPFDLYYKEYDEWYERNRFAYLTELEALKREIPRNKRGLEVGVGTGRFASPLGVPFGIDPSVGMIKVAKDRGVEVVQGVGEEMPFPDSAFDYVLLAITICFLEDPDRTILEVSCSTTKVGSFQRLEQALRLFPHLLVRGAHGSPIPCLSLRHGLC